MCIECSARPYDVTRRVFPSLSTETKNEIVKLIKKLADQSKVPPRSVYKTYSHGVQHKKTFTRTTQVSECLMRNTEKTTIDELFPKMLGENVDQNLSKSLFISDERRWSKKLDT